ncbi:MAG: RsmE family RNA methyltransferase [Acidimicrobiia bacterium]|nr:RsmE family RNA methyltransferase [Acidimicrobiia bacterium]
MTQGGLAGSAGPHVFVDSLDAMVVGDDDLAHLSKSLRMRDGDVLTVSDGAGSWRPGRFHSSGSISPDGEIHHIEPRDEELTIAFSLVKGNKPELVLQKLTELGIDRIVVLAAERSIVKWDETKVERTRGRWQRIIREAAMQSHRVRLPHLEAVLASHEWLSRPGVAIAQFGGPEISPVHRSVAIGPEGGWSPAELEAASESVSLGNTVLRAETAAIAAGTLLCAAARSNRADVR